MVIVLQQSPFCLSICVLYNIGISHPGFFVGADQLNPVVGIAINVPAIREIRSQAPIANQDIAVHVPGFRQRQLPSVVVKNKDFSCPVDGLGQGIKDCIQAALVFLNQAGEGVSSVYQCAAGQIKIRRNLLYNLPQRHSLKGIAGIGLQVA